MPIIMTGKRFQDSAGNTTTTFTGGFETSDLSEFEGGSNPHGSVVNSTELNGNYLYRIAGSGKNDVGNWIYGGSDISDQRSSIIYNYNQGSHSSTIAARYQDNDNYYFARHGGNGDFMYGKYVNGNRTLFGNLSTASLTGMLVIQAIGDQITFEKRSLDGTTIYESQTVTDSDLTSGYVAFGGNISNSGGFSSYAIDVDDVTQEPV